MPGADCLGPSLHESWTQLRATEIEFGLDYLAVSPRGSQVTIRSVRLTGVRGDLQLYDVAFSPGGAVGNGFKWGSPAATLYPLAWSHRATVGATLTDAPHPTATRGYPRGDDCTVWQLVVGVRATGGSGGNASSLQVSYTADGIIRILNTKIAIAVLSSQALCSKFSTQKSE